MAYINQEKKKQIADAIKKAFPRDRFSFSIKHHSSLLVKIVKSEVLEKYHSKEMIIKQWGELLPCQLDFSNYNINVFWVESNFKEYPEVVEYLMEIIRIIKQSGNHYNNSDLMSDYHDEAFYYDIDVCLKGVKPLEKS